MSKNFRLSLQREFAILSTTRNLQMDLDRRDRLFWFADGTIGICLAIQMVEVCVA
jgi:hypothetical protein